MKLSAFSDTDQREIEALFVQTFSDSEGQVEGELIGRLVHNLMTGIDAANLLGFVATEGRQVIGCIFFTRLMFEPPREAFLLSPVAVHTRYQGQGVGQKLIRYGLESLAVKGVEFVLTYGDPSYYSKVGFSQVSQHLIVPPFTLSHPDGWLGQRLGSGEIDGVPGRARCVEPFCDPRFW